jgi:hypothetical protein
VKSGYWRLLPWVIVAAWLVRVWFALTGRNIHYADEIFSYLEPAHRLVFGDGLVSWEFRFGVRSWTVPMLMALPLWLCDLVGAGRPEIYIPVARLLLVTLSVSVVPALYVLTRALAGERAGRWAAVLAAGWYELIYFAPRPLTDALSLYPIVIGLALVVSAPGSRTVWVAWLTGVAVVIRLQSAPVALLCAVVEWRHSDWPSRRRALLIWGGLCLLAGAFDRWTWGGWWASYLSNLYFNGLLMISEIYGRHHPLTYPYMWLLGSCGVFMAAAGWATTRWRQFQWPLGLIALLLATYTAFEHKEYRFVLLLVPLGLVLTASWVASWSSDLARRLAAVGLAVVSVAGMWGVLPGHFRLYPHQPLFAADPSLDAYAAIANDPSVTALLVADDEWWYSGGYYYLHRPIPLYFVPDALAMRAADPEGEHAYVSHVLHRGSSEGAQTIDTPGFETVARWGAVELRRNTRPGPYRAWPGLTRQMPEPLIDERYTPWVRPFIAHPR